MSIRLQHMREAWSFLSSFVGKPGEIAVDTTNNRMIVHDGATPGGWPVAKLSEVVTNTRTAVADADHTVAATDRLVAYTSLFAARVVTLPAASAYPTGIRLSIVDESGACSATNTLTINRAGSDTINGATSAVISMAFGFLALESDGSGKWTIVDQRAFDAVSTAGVVSFAGKIGVGTTAPQSALSVNGGVAIGTTYAGTNAAAMNNLIVEGNLGIGTATPTVPLYVETNIANAATSNVIVENASGTNAQVRIALQRAADLGAGVARGTVLFASTNTGFANYEAGSIIFYTNTVAGSANARQVILATGDVGLGGVVNTATLSGATLTVLAAGKVGIGTTTPAQPLDVAGIIQTHGAHGSNIQLGVIEDLITCSGASSVSAQQIPNRAIVLAVSVYVMTAITGATSFNVDATTNSGGGAGTTAGQFGANLGLAAGSSNIGVIGPTAWYAPSTITLTANSSNFTGGQVRISIQYMLCGAPTS
jgi:hypothetical protein